MYYAYLHRAVLLSFPAAALALARPGAAAELDASAEAAVRPATELARVEILDDGERIPQDARIPLPESPFPGGVELFALRGETVAFQVVVLAADPSPRTFHAGLGAFAGAGGALLSAEVSVLAEHFVEIRRPTGNTRDGSSLAWTEAARPRPPLLGFWADALLPRRDAVSRSGERGALWIDVHVPDDAAPGLYESTLSVSTDAGTVATRAVRLRVLPQAMPWGALPVMVYYDPGNLDLRMGSRAAEPQLRALLHAHHLSAFRPVLNLADLEREIPYLTGEAFSFAQGYRGPGLGLGEGILVLGSYGDLGEPSAKKIPEIERMVARLATLGSGAESFLYAVDEDCKSPWPGAWRALLDASQAARSLRVGATCGLHPREQRADVIMSTPEELDPAKAAAARALGKVVWAYNGKRPHAGPMTLDAPAIDLRANAWIAERHGIPRWFYWEVSSWTERGGGKVGPASDPFTVAESFHNKDGDHSNGDGILVYPGTQSGGMRSFGESAVFPSVRLKNIRRGVQDAGYIRLARARDTPRTDAVVARMIPASLASATGPAAWPERGGPWQLARRELADIFATAPATLAPQAKTAPSAPQERPREGRLSLGLSVVAIALALFLWGSRKSA